jgi:nucleoside-diphosphate-sugar epimerase
MKYKTLLLTGATGFLGSHLLEALLLEGYHVIILKRSTSDTWRIKHLLEQCSSYDVDQISLEEIFKLHQIDYIIHLATFYKKAHIIDDIIPMFDTNVTFPAKLLDLATAHGVKGFINTGTFFEYDPSILPISEANPIKTFNLYAKSKLAFEQILKSYADEGKIKAVTLKIFSPFGPKDDVNKLIPFIVSKALKNEPISLSEGFQKLDFIYAGDIAQAYLKTLTQIDTFSEYESFNIGSGNSYSVREVISLLEELMERSINKTWGSPSTVDNPVIIASRMKAKEQLYWVPQTSLRSGLKETIQYYKENAL